MSSKVLEEKVKEKLLPIDKITSELIENFQETAKEITRKYRMAVKNNAELYSDDAMEIEDYLACPVLGLRMKRLDERYARSTFGLSLEEYRNRYNIPEDYPTITKKTVAKTQETTNTKVDPTTGKTARELQAEEAKKTRSKVGDDGLTNYQRTGAKTSAGLLKKDEFGITAAAKGTAKGRAKAVKTRAEITSIDPNDKRYELSEVYKWFVYWLGANNEEKVLNTIPNDGEVYECDHRLSVSDGYYEKVSPWLVANLSNMELLTKQENRTKHNNSSISKTDLIRLCQYTDDQNEQEFKLFVQCAERTIEEAKSDSSPVNSLGIFLKFNESIQEKKPRY